MAFDAKYDGARYDPTEVTPSSADTERTNGGGDGGGQMEMMRRQVLRFWRGGTAEVFYFFFQFFSTLVQENRSADGQHALLQIARHLPPSVHDIRRSLTKTRVIIVSGPH